MTWVTGMESMNALSIEDLYAKGDFLLPVEHNLLQKKPDNLL